MAEAVPMLSLELLPGWYEDWILFEGENWRQQRLHALEAAAEALAADERWGNAIAAAEAAVSADPLRESARAALIEVHLREGNQSEALREFERYKRLLDEELGLMPTPRLRTLMPGAGRGDVTDVGRGRLVAMSVAGAQRAGTYPLEAVTRQSRRRHGATEY